MVELADFPKFIAETGLVGLLTLVLIGGYKGWWIYSREYTRVAEENKELKEMLKANTAILERITDATEKAVALAQAKISGGKREVR